MSKAAEVMLGLVQSDQYTAQELEIMKERASALGRAGDQLAAALKAYAHAETVQEKDACCGDAAYRLWTLMVQREAMGLALNNLGWIRDAYAIPDEVWRCYLRI